MRKLIVSEFMSLDGVVEAPMWTFPYWNDEIAEFKHHELFNVDALLLGRVTYEGFAEAWPSQTDQEGYADRMNSLPKYVASTTIETAECNNSSVINGNLIEAVQQLKQEAGQDILVFGSGSLVSTLMEYELVDEYRLQIYPLVLGKGQRLFEDKPDAKLEMVNRQAFNTGVVVLTYRPAENN